MWAAATMPGDGGATTENRECPGMLTGAGFVADRSRGAVDDHPRSGTDYGADLGAGSGRRAALLFDQKSHQLLRVVRGRKEFRQHGATHAAVKTTQQTSAYNADRSGQDGAATHRRLSHAL